MSNESRSNTTTLPEKQSTLINLINEFNEYEKRTAIISFEKESATKITYGQLYDLIRKLAAGFTEKGMERGERAIFMANNSPAWIVNFLAVVYTGATPVPIDYQQSEESIKHIFSDTSAKWIFCDNHSLEILKKLFPRKHFQLVNLDEDNQKSNWRKFLSSHLALAPETNGNEEAIIFYTSGTSGLPKGVPLTHANITMQLDSAIAKTKILKLNDRLLLPLPLYHVYPLNIGLLATLKMKLPGILPYSLTGPEILRAITKGKATVLVGVPRLLRALYSGIESRFHENKLVGMAFDASLNCCVNFERVSGLRVGSGLFSFLHRQFCPSLRLLTSGGAPLEEDLSRKLHALGYEIAVGYGLTETAPLLSMRMPEETDHASVGKPIEGVQIRIHKNAKASDNSEEGEIEASGANIFSAYLNSEAETKSAFTEDAWFKTGDLGYLKNESLHVTGRISSTLVMEGGKKLQPEDLEKKYSANPEIKEIGILQVEHKLVALVLPEHFTADQKNSADSENKNNREKISQALAMVARELPSYMKITDFAITSEALPRTNIGKIKRMELKESYEQAKASPNSAAQKRGSQQSIQDMQADDRIMLEEPSAQQAWEWLKRRFPNNNLTLDTNPQLDLNIDSFEWMNISLELRETTGLELSEESIARISTLRDLISELTKSKASAKDSKASPLKEPRKYLSKEQKRWLKPLSHFELALAKSLYLLNSFLMHSLFNVSAQGLENISQSQFVMTPNHASYLDIFAICAVIPFETLKQSQIAGWTGIAFANPFNSFMSRLVRAFPIDASRSLISSLALAAAVLQAQRNLIWFPEGERTLNGKLLKFRPGIGMLLEKSKVLTIPVYLKGTRQALPPGSFFPHFGKIEVIFGKPVSQRQLTIAGKGETNAERIANALHDKVAALESAVSTKTNNVSRKSSVLQIAKTTSKADAQSDNANETKTTGLNRAGNQNQRGRKRTKTRTNKNLKKKPPA